MTDTPEIAEWLTRFEKRFGVNQTQSALQKLNNARDLFYSELGYNITRKQFEALGSESNDRTRDMLIERNVRRETGRRYVDKNNQQVYQINYRDSTTGRFVKNPNK